ncbi:MAG: TatD family hydrolase [Labilithrix sp.]|nr:TatD family hydrolase [Labilithrix sp.]
MSKKRAACALSAATSSAASLRWANGQPALRSGDASAPIRRTPPGSRSSRKRSSPTTLTSGTIRHARTRATSLIDTHCHLDPQYFPSGRTRPSRAPPRGRRPRLRRHRRRTRPRSSARAAIEELARRLPDRIGSAVGVHPHDAVTLDDAAYAELAALAREPEVLAVGEIGLDYHYDHSRRALQREVFARLVHLARDVDKPIVVHTRSAPADTLEILEREGARDVGGVIHCFSEDRAFAERALNLGFDLSFSGIVTFKSSSAIQDVAAWAPADRILVETDSPYLAPVPLRGKPCEAGLRRPHGAAWRAPRRAVQALCEATRQKRTPSAGSGGDSPRMSCPAHAVCLHRPWAVAVQRYGSAAR